MQHRETAEVATALKKIHYSFPSFSYRDTTRPFGHPLADKFEQMTL